MLETITNKLQFYANKMESKPRHLRLILALSGGIDSMALAYCLIQIRKKMAFRLAFAHLNHTLHNEADRAAEFCKVFAKENKVKYYSKNLYFKDHVNFEANAREKRYNYLNRIAEKEYYHFIITAHHKNDQIETVFMKQYNNSDWISQIGIREELGKVIRPLLNVSKTDIIRYAKENGLQWVEDPTNNNLKYFRNEVRRKLLPEALKNNANLENTLLQLSVKYYDKFQKIINGFRSFGVILFNSTSKGFVSINLSLIKKFSIEKFKIFIYWCSMEHFAIQIPTQNSGFWLEFAKFIKFSKTGSMFKLYNLDCYKDRDQLIILDPLVFIQTQKYKFPLNNNSYWLNGQFKVLDQNLHLSSLDKNSFSLPREVYNRGLFIRHWKNGDKIRLASTNNIILISDIFINNKLSIVHKKVQPLVVDREDSIFWVPGFVYGKLPHVLGENRYKRIDWKSA